VRFASAGCGNQNPRNNRHRDPPKRCRRPSAAVTLVSMGAYWFPSYFLLVSRK
jgi:hypothetical protein